MDTATGTAMQVTAIMAITAMQPVPTTHTTTTHQPASKSVLKTILPASSISTLKMINPLQWITIPTRLPMPVTHTSL